MNSFTRIGLRSRFLLVLMIGLILPTLSVWGQNATITGKVVDPKGEPLVGVSVLEQGTTNGTCLLYTSPSPRDISGSRMPSSA